MSAKAERGFQSIRDLLAQSVEMGGKTPIVKADTKAAKDMDKDMEGYDAMAAEGKEHEEPDGDEDEDEDEGEDDEDGDEQQFAKAAGELEPEEFVDAEPIIKAFSAKADLILQKLEGIEGRVAALEGVAVVPEQNVLMAKAAMGTNEQLERIVKAVGNISGRLEQLEATLDITPKAPKSAFTPQAPAQPAQPAFNPKTLIMKAAIDGVKQGLFTAADVSKLESVTNSGKDPRHFVTDEQWAFLTSANERSAN